MMIPERKGSQLDKTLPYCTSKLRSLCEHIEKPKVSNEIDYICILGNGLELACN